MKKYEVISFDMFQTLVDVNQKKTDIWKAIFGAEYTKEKEEVALNSFYRHLMPSYEQAVAPFQTMEEMYMECSRRIIEDTGFAADPKQMAYQIMFYHGYAPFYEETFEVLKELRENYRIVLSTDSNQLMVAPLLKQIEVEEAFISDDMRCYKGERSGKFFQILLSKLRIAPEKVLHIGDSMADVMGARMAGIDSCWINRDTKVWKGKVEPTYQITSLRDVLDLL